jgi:hypothetical protein
VVVEWLNITRQVTINYLLIIYWQRLYRLLNSLFRAGNAIAWRDEFAKIEVINSHRAVDLQYYSHPKTSVAGLIRTG